LVDLLDSIDPVDPDLGSRLNPSIAWALTQRHINLDGARTMNAQQITANPRTSLLLSVVVIAMLGGCSSDAKDEPRPPQPEELYGLWDRTGYGYALLVDEFGATQYEYTRAGCLISDFLTNREIAEIFNEPTLSNDSAQLTTLPSDDLAFESRFERLERLPELCLEETLITERTATVTFEHLWHTFNDYYAFFTERGIDWNAQYTALRPLVNDSLSDEDLYDIIEELLTPLDDGHVFLAYNDEIDGFAERRGANQVILESFPLQSEYDDINDYAAAIGSQYVQIRNSYFDEGSIRKVEGAQWGTIGGQVGYLRIGTMTDLLDVGDNVGRNLDAINEIMQSAMADLSATEALIIDVRINGGGEDAVSLAIANYFTDQRRLAVTRVARSHAGDTAPVEAYIDSANETPYLNPVAVIAAPDTASAAEIFLMAMSSLPQVTLVGENSQGILSVILSRTLPNDWVVSLSNEVYADAMGVNHEVTGVPPQVTAATFSLEAIEEGRDAAIDAALDTLGYSQLSSGQ